jgi:hypothetical protein
LCYEPLIEAKSLCQLPGTSSSAGEFSVSSTLHKKGIIMSPQTGWILQEQIVPRLRASIPRNVHPVGSEDAEELIQDGTAIAALMLHSVELAGKSVTPGNIAYYTLQHLKSGRRSSGQRFTNASRKAN